MSENDYPWVWLESDAIWAQWCRKNRLKPLKWTSLSLKICTQLAGVPAAPHTKFRRDRMWRSTDGAAFCKSVQVAQCSTVDTKLFQNGIEIDKCSGGVPNMTFPMLFFQTCTLLQKAAQSVLLHIRSRRNLVCGASGTPANCVQSVSDKEVHLSGFKRFLRHHWGQIASDSNQTHG